LFAQMNNPFANQTASANKYGGLSSESYNNAYSKEKERKGSNVQLQEPNKFSSREDRIAALKRRENEIKIKETELRTREEMLAKGIGFAPQKNWPCLWWPLFRHHIKADIPVEYQKIVFQFYMCWLFTALCLLWNWLCMTMWWFWPDTSPDDQSMTMLLASLYLFAGVPFSFLWWYKRFYDAMQNTVQDLSCSHQMNFLIHIAFSGFCIIGAPECGTAGFLNMIKIFAHKQSGLGLCFLVALTLWSLNFAISCYLQKEAHFIYSVREVEKRLGRKIRIDEASLGV